MRLESIDALILTAVAGELGKIQPKRLVKPIADQLKNLINKDIEASNVVELWDVLKSKISEPSDEVNNFTKKIEENPQTPIIDAYLAYINFKIRKPLYEIYSSEKVDKLNELSRYHLLNALMFLTIKYPLNEKCLLTEAAPVKKAHFASGHFADADELVKSWKEDEDFNLINPYTNKVISNREIIFNFPDAEIRSIRFDSLYKIKSTEDFRNEYENDYGSSSFILNVCLSMIIGITVAAALPAVLFGSAALGVVGAVSTCLFTSLVVGRTYNKIANEYFDHAAKNRHEEFKRNISLIEPGLNRELKKLYTTDSLTFFYLNKTLTSKLDKLDNKISKSPDSVPERSSIVKTSPINRSSSAAVISMPGLQTLPTTAVTSETVEHSVVNTSEQSTVFKLSQADRVTFNRVKEALEKFSNRKPFVKIDESLNYILQNDTQFSNLSEFNEYLNTNIRTPLYEIFRDKKYNIYENGKTELFDMLMLMAHHYPINDKCYLTNAALKDFRVTLLSGHVINDEALLNLWNKDQVLKHPALSGLVDEREVLFNFPKIDYFWMGANYFSELTNELVDREPFTFGTALVLLVSAAALWATIIAATVSVPLLIVPMIFGPIAELTTLVLTGISLLATFLLFIPSIELRDRFVEYRANQRAKNFIKSNAIDKTINEIIKEKGLSQYNEFAAFLTHHNSLRKQAVLDQEPKETLSAVETSSTITQSPTKQRSDSNNWGQVGFHSSKAPSPSNTAVLANDENIKRVSLGNT